jgi:hypothetical protein
MHATVELAHFGVSSAFAIFSTTSSLALQDRLREPEAFGVNRAALCLRQAHQNLPDVSEVGPDQPGAMSSEMLGQVTCRAYRDIVDGVVQRVEAGLAIAGR